MAYKWQIFSLMDQFHSDSGNVLAGGLLVFTASGSSTATNFVYADPRGSRNLGTNVRLNSAGQPDSNIYLEPSTTYRLTVKDNSGNIVGSYTDGIIGRSVGALGTVAANTIATTAFANLTTANRLIGFNTGPAALINVAKPLDLAAATLTSANLADDYVFVSKTLYTAAAAMTINLTGSYNSWLVVFSNISCSAVSYTANTSSMADAFSGANVNLVQDTRADTTDSGLKSTKTTRRGLFGSNTTDTSANMANTGAYDGQAVIEVSRGTVTSYESFFPAYNAASTRQAFAEMYSLSSWTVSPALTSITVTQTGGTLTGLVYVYGRPE